MDVSERNSHFRERTVDPSRSYDRSTPGYQESDCIVNRHINPRWNHDSVLGSHPTIRYGQNREGMRGDYIRVDEDLYFSSPFSTERSWPREEYNTPHHSLKRFPSSSSIDCRPNKRPQGYDSPARMKLSLAIRGDVFNQGLLEGGEYWDQRQINPDDLGAMHPSATRSSSQQRYDAKSQHHPAYQTSPHRRDSLQSTPYGLKQTPRHPNIDAIQSDGQRYVKRTQTPNPESNQAYQDGPSQTLFTKRPSLPAPQFLHSPIWNDNASRGRQRRGQRRDKSTRSYSQSPQRKSGKHELCRVYPFDDGGSPAEGGSSSDGEGILLDPVVVGRVTHQGGTRGGYVAEGSGQEAITIQEALQELEDNPYVPMDIETIWNRQDRVNRRKLKLASRKFKAQWDAASVKNDYQEMKNIEAKARKQGIPLRGQREIVLSRSPSPHTPSRRRAQYDVPYSPSATRSEYAIPSPHQNDLVAYVGQPNPSQKQSEKSRKGTQESRCSSHRQGRQRGVRTMTEGGRNQSGVSQVPNTQQQEHSPSLQNIADEVDSTPMEQLFRNTRRSSQRRDISEISYRAADVLPNESMLYNDHVDQGDKNKSRRHLSSLTPQTGNDHDDAHGIKSKDGVVITPRSRVQPEPDVTGARAMNVDSPEVINLVSSTEGTPVPARYLPMKERIDPPRKKAVSKQGKFRANIPRAAKGRGNAKRAEDADVARQQRCADVIVAKESKVANEDFQKEIFGDVIGLTAEEKEHQIELKRKEAQLKQEVELQAEIDKVQTRCVELEEQKAIEEARVKERLAKDREEQSKKLKREVERKKQLQIEEVYREEKRKLATERIEAQRAKDKTLAKAREKEQEKIRTIEFDKLKLEIMRKDLELKRLQAASLSVVKVSNPGAFRNPATNTKSAIAITEDTLFVSDNADVTDVNDNRLMQPMVAGARSVTELFAKHSNFQSMMAEDRERVQAEQKVLGAKKKAAAIQVRLNAMRKSVESVKEKPKQPKSRKSRLSAKVKTKSCFEEPQNMLANFFQPSIPDDSSEPQSVWPKQRNSRVKRPERPTSTPIPNSAPIYAVEPPKVYSSEIRLLTDVEVENTEKLRKARDEAIKRKHLAERRARELPQIALKHKNKLIEEAAMAGFTLSDNELKIRVESHMKKLEQAYQKKQAKKTGSISFDSYLASQSQPQGPEQQESTQPQAQQDSLWFSGNSSETEQGDRELQIQDLVQSELPAAPRRQRSVRTVSDLAARLPKALADKYQSDSESEEDPDDEETLEETGAEHTEGSGSEANKCSVNPHGTQLEGGMGAGSATQGVISNPSAGSNSEVTNTQSQNPNQKYEPQIKIYKVKKNEMKGAQELAESIKILHDRDQANDMAKDLLKLYCQQADGDERSFSREFKDGLFYGKVELNDDNSMEVRVTSEFATPSKFGIDVSKLNNLHGEQVWIIKQELKKTVQDPQTANTSTTHLKEDINDLVYTDRSYANTLACDELIKYLKPPKQYQALYEKCWANEWSKQIRDALTLLEGTNECFEVEIDRTELADRALAWLEWDIVRYVVEVRNTHGPRN